VEEGPELLLLIAVRGGMLLPNEGVRGDREEIAEILGLERPEGDELALQNRLEVEGHGRRYPSCPSLN
jgi:hypothetical protein